MAYDRFLIAPYNSGLITDLPSWLTPEDSFQTLENVSICNGRIKKRFGADLTTSSILTSRVRILLSKIDTTKNTDGSGDGSGTLTGYIFSIGQRFSIGTETYTLTAFGAPGVLTPDSGAATVHTLDTTSGAFVFTGAAASKDIYFCPDGNSGDIKTDPATGNATGYVPGYIYKPGQMFLIDTEVFTVPSTGLPVNMLSTGTGTGTFNTTTGAFTISGAALDKNIYFYPSEPIMGITHYESGPVNEHVTYAMDTQFIYLFSGTAWEKDTLFTAITHGSNKNFFWSDNYVGITSHQLALFITNYNATKLLNISVTPVDTDDYIYSYNGTTWENFSKYTKFNSDEDYIASAKIIISWKNRLLMFNLIERDVSDTKNYYYPNRVRYSHNGSPFPIPDAAPAATVGHPWLQARQTYVGVSKTYKSDGAGYLDMPVEEEIISVAIVKDRVIVYCERSTWELAYTGNPSLPFIWKNINATVGSESTYSSVDFDTEAVTIATTGIYACNGSNVYRIDNQIPEEVFSFLKTSEGTSRVHGIRDYYNEIAYWTVLKNQFSTTNTYPNKILAFNYNNKSWSYYDDTITTFGYFEQSTDRTWAWDVTWDEAETWGSYYQQENSRMVLAGNHQGFLFLINNDRSYNASVMTVASFILVGNTATVTIIDHNLNDGDFVMFADANITYADGPIYKIKLIDADTFTISDTAFAGTYKGKGTITRVSKINIVSKDWNPYVKNGGNVDLGKIDFCVTNQPEAEVTVTYSTDSTTVDLVDESMASGSILGSNILEMHKYAIESDYVDYQTVLWRTIYFQAAGYSVNINITLSDDQMLDGNIALSPFELQGMLLYTSRKGR